MLSESDEGALMCPRCEAAMPMDRVCVPCADTEEFDTATNILLANAWEPLMTLEEGGWIDLELDSYEDVQAHAEEVEQVKG